MSARYTQSRVIDRELVDRPGKPSQILREVEASLIGELARSVALSDKRFDGWPTVKLGEETDWLRSAGGLRLVAEVGAL